MYTKYAKLVRFAVGVVVGSTALTAWQPRAKAEIDTASAPVVVSKSTSSAPTPPSEESATCWTGPNSPVPDGVSSTCPVVQANGRTFWPFRYLDNRHAIDLVGYDSTGKKVSQRQLNGPRYIWKVTVDAKTQTVAFWGQRRSATLPWSAVPAPAPVVVGTFSRAPKPPSGEFDICGSSKELNRPCPVVKANGQTFWHFGYFDARIAIDVIGYDSTGKKVSQQQLNGVPWVDKVTVDAKAQTVTFWYFNQHSSLPWSAFLPQAPVVVSKSTSSAPTPPPYLVPADDSCWTGPNSPKPDDLSSTCPVVEANGLTFWPFGYRDNRTAFDVVGYDATGKKVSEQEFRGPRYIWKATVDGKAQRVVFWGQHGLQGGLPWSAFAPGAAPSLVVKSRSLAPTPPSGLSVDCWKGPNSPSPDGPSEWCHVVQFNGLTFWPLGYRDNRLAFDLVGVVGYDPTGPKSYQANLKGSRNIWDETVDPIAETVLFLGQTNPQASLPWSAFAPH